MRGDGFQLGLHALPRRRDKGVDRERLIYVNFEDEQLAGLQAAQLNWLLEDYYRRFPAFRQQEWVSFFLDEIQQVQDWERFVRRVLDSEKVEVFVSGSSAALLSREIATAMRGRAWEAPIHPFSFDEYLRHHQLPVPKKPDCLAPAERSAVELAP